MSTLTKKNSSSLPNNGSSRLRAKGSRQFSSADAMLTIEDWQALSDTKPPYELLEGKLVQKMTTTSDHAWAAGQFLIALANWGQEKGWKFFPEGMGYKADENNGFVPDVVGFSPSQKVLPSVTYMSTPFVAVEVLSPATAKRDRSRKREFYAIGGVQLYVIIDTGNRTLEIFRLEENRYSAPEVLGGKDVWQPQELPGLKLELKNLWMN